MDLNKKPTTFVTVNKESEYEKGKRLAFGALFIGIAVILFCSPLFFLGFIVLFVGIYYCFKPSIDKVVKKISKKIKERDDEDPLKV